MKQMKEKGKTKSEKVRSSLLFTFSLLLFTSAANAAEITINVGEGQTFAYAIDGGELISTGEVGPAKVTFAANRNATYSFYGVESDGTASPLGDPLVVTEDGVTVNETGNANVAVDTRATKEVDCSAGAVKVTYSGDNWGATVGESATITLALGEGEAKTYAEGLKGNGTVEWTPLFDGTYVFQHMAGKVIETATFNVVGFPGGEGNRWKIGAGDEAAVTAYVKDGYLYLAGAGEVMEFGGDGAPWAVYEQLGYPLAGAVLPRTITLPASVLATMPFSVKGGAEPSGAIGGAEFEQVQIVGGTAYLGVSVYTSDTITNQNWSVATNGVIEVPAEGKSGFFYLMSKPAQPSNAPHSPIFIPQNIEE